MKENCISTDSCARSDSHYFSQHGPLLPGLCCVICKQFNKEDMIMCDLSVIHLDLKENGQNQSVTLDLL